MTSKRLFKSADFLQASEDEPIRSVVTESPEHRLLIAWSYFKTIQMSTKLS